MSEQSSNNLDSKAASLLSEQELSTLPVRISDLKALKHHQSRSLLHFSEEDDPLDTAITVSGEQVTPQSIAVDLEVDHDGTVLYVRGQVLPGNIKPPLIIVHEFGENISRYRGITRALLEQGYNVYTFDLRGHGRSGKMLGHVEKMSSLADDLAQVCAWVKHRESGRAGIIIAHGLSALIACKTVLRQAKFCRACVLVAPTLKLVSRFARPKSFLVGLAADIYPQMKLPQPMVPRFQMFPRGFKGPQGRVSSRMRLSAQFVHEVWRSFATAPAKFMRLKVPTLLLLPTKDTIADQAIVRELVERHRFAELITKVEVDETFTDHQMITDDVPESMQLCVEHMRTWLHKLNSLDVSGAGSV